VTCSKQKNIPDTIFSTGTKPSLFEIRGMGDLGNIRQSAKMKITFISGTYESENCPDIFM
jgi:hypothetical protein